VGGWLCPIYKKKDITKIENYRPITLLNTDHKLLTKALSFQLINHIKTMVHLDQASFIPGRSIFNHIRLTKIMIKYAEQMETNGAIIALDQEKAYDKINHLYLWKTLEAFNLPPAFHNTVRTLYKNASTTVTINGELSSRYHVTHGVRQGDPLSCFLFTLAIEPMACLLHNSLNIIGFDILGLAEKLIVNLFADDTVIYAHDRDSFDEIQQLLKLWCDASGAKFNMEKTEIIPIDTKEHQEDLIRARKLNPNDATLSEEIHITQDSKAICSLGAWIGNEVDDLQPWEPTIDKIRKDLEHWNKLHPTLDGKRHIIHAVVGGWTQFLAKAQGMPISVQDTIIKEINTFLWGEDTKALIAKETLYNDIPQGGIGLLNLQAQNEALNVMWLKDYLNMSPMRPTWAFVADDLIRESAPKNIPNGTVNNTFLQTWNTPTKGKRAEALDCDTTQLLKTAKRIKLQFAPLCMSCHLKEQMPAWLQIGKARKTPQNQFSRCLTENHKVHKMKDLVKMTKRLDNLRYQGFHSPYFTCYCSECNADRRNGCQDSHRCATEVHIRLQKLTPKFNPYHNPALDNLTLTRRCKQGNFRVKQNNGQITFDLSITSKTNLAECF
jgi:hypothetical protein